MKHRFVIRLGHPKCGSTFFGKSVFPRLSGITFVGKPYDPEKPFREIVERIIGQQPWDEERCKSLLADALLTIPTEYPVVISDSRIGQPLEGRADLVPTRMRAVFGDCRVYLTARSQVQYVKSLYFQHIGTEKTDLGINDWIRTNWDQGVMIRSFLDYDAIYRRFAAVFGDDNVRINFLEMLNRDRERFAAELADMLQVDGEELATLCADKPRNVRASKLQMRLLAMPRFYAFARGIAKLLPANIYNVASRVSGHDEAYDPIIDDDLIAIIEDFAVHSNRRLGEKLDLPFETYGYSV